MSVAGDETAKIAACDTEGKKNFAKVLGKPESEVDDVDFAEGKRDAAMSTVKDAMEGCIGSIDSTATTQQKATAKKACKTTNAKKALKETLGAKSSEISDEDTEVYVRDAAAKSCADKMEACIKAAKEAGSTGKERENCVDEVKAHKKAITGDDAISRVEVEELLKKGKDGHNPNPNPNGMGGRRALEEGQG